MLQGHKAPGDEQASALLLRQLETLQSTVGGVITRVGICLISG